MNRQATADALGMHERASASKDKGSPSSANALGRAPDWLPERLTLATLQRWFLDVITTPESEAAPIDELSATRLATPGPRLSALSRVDIYRRGYHLRLLECLADDYPVLAGTLGPPEFEALCRRYVAEHPSQSPSLNEYGQHMAEHCRRSTLAHADFLAELSRLEWAVVQSIHAPTAATLSVDELGLIPGERWPDARLRANPSLCILAFAYPVNAHFQAHFQGQTLPVPKPRASSLAVYRTSRSVWRLELTAPMETLFSALASGTPLGAALEQVAPLLAEQSENEAAALVGGWFRHGVASGLFSAVTLD